MKFKEACMEGVHGWHVSPFSFSTPKINYKAGFGTTFYGAGFYITLDKSVVDVIKGEAQDMFAEYFIYTVEVDERANIVDEDEEDGLALYAKLVEEFGGDEVKASEEMVNRGIDGILYYSEEDGESIVFYNPKMAKIVKTEYFEGWGDRSEIEESIMPRNKFNSSKLREAKSEEEFQDAIYDLEAYFDVNAEGNKFYLNRPVTDMDWEEYIYDVCKNHGVKFEPIPGRNNAYQVLNESKLNEETQKIDVIEKANYQELVDSVYAAARSGVTNIRVRVRDDEYLDLLGDVPAREFKENKLREGAGDIYINAHMYQGIPVMDVTVNNKCIYSSDWGSIEQARAAAADLRAFLSNRDRVGGLKELLNTWEYSYILKA